MASIITGSGMSAALKAQCKSVRAAVEKRPKKAKDCVDRAHHVARFVAYSYDGRAAVEYTVQPSIEPWHRHAISCGLSRREQVRRAPQHFHAARIADHRASTMPTRA